MSNDFNVQFETNQILSVDFQQDSFVADFGPGVPTGDYDGPYEVEATNEYQVLSTRDKTLSADIVIDPIPNNYGLITWNGSILTVS